MSAPPKALYNVGMISTVSDLNPKQWRFVQEYLVDLNGTQSAIRAGYAPVSAHVTASRLIRNHKVAAEIARLQRGSSYELDEIRDGVIVSLMQIAEESDKPRHAIKALDLLARHLGMFNDCCAHCVQAQKDAAQARFLRSLQGV